MADRPQRRPLCARQADFGALNQYLIKFGKTWIICPVVENRQTCGDVEIIKTLLAPVTWFLTEQ